MEKTGQCIVNMVSTKRGTHPLFRAFGISELDGMPITRATLQVEVSTWYPQARVRAVSIESANEKGEFSYRIDVEGR